MALKFMKINSLSPPTTSPPEKMLNPLATNLRMQNVPALATGARNGTAMGAAPSHGIKRGRESSEEENSSDEDHPQGRFGGGTRPAASDRQRKNKRLRTGEHKWNMYHSREPRREISSDEEEEETMTPSPVKRTGIDIGALSLTPPTPVSSEYANVNGLLKMLHLNRGSHEARESKSVRKDSDRQFSTSSAQKSMPATAVQACISKADDTEKVTVTSIYEEANRALGRLMLDRRKTAQFIRRTGAEDEENEYESTGSSDED